MLINSLLLTCSYLYKNIKYKNDYNLKKVNVGCGLHCLPEWINIDGSLTAVFGSKKLYFINKVLYKLSGASYHHSFNDYNNVVRKNNLKFYNFKIGFPILDNYADVIYSSHFLEHLDKEDGERFLQNCLRSLKKGGLMRIVIPDLDFAIKMYQDDQVEDVLDTFFYNSKKHDFSAHKYMYNFSFLKDILEKLGFINVSKVSYKAGKCPDIDYLDNYPNSLFIECNK